MDTEFLSNVRLDFVFYWWGQGCSLFQHVIYITNDGNYIDPFHYYFT